MTNPITIHSHAQLDIEEATFWYEVERPGLGAFFLESLDHLLERIASSPRQFPEIDEGVRRGLMHRFPYGVYFILDSTGVVVLAVLHLKRRPGLWKNRLTVEG